jgi:glutathione S-transferase
MASTDPILYGLDASQPCRSVSWLLRMHNQPFEYVMIMPGQKKDGGSRSEGYLKLNPQGTVPLLQHNGISLAEGMCMIIPGQEFILHK